MANRTIIPFGPQHPVLPEPIHLDLVVEDEKVVEAIPQFGFIHRGLEKLVEKKDFIEYVYVAERICGICSFIHGMGYCHTVEKVMGVQVPERAQFLRTIWSELSRMHSHLLWAGLLADSFGFENLFMATWRVREKILDMFEETTGGRVIFSVCKIGGSRRDVPDETLKRFVKELRDLEPELREVLNIFIKDYTVQQRLVDVGVLSHDDAYSTGAVGPTIRGSGWALDMRKSGYGSYAHLDVEPQVETAGDSYARCLVRIREILQAIDIIGQCVDKIPGGPVDVKVSGFPKGEYMSRLEQPRGEVIYYAKGNGTKHLDRFRVRTPTFANIAPLLKMLQGCQLADVGVIVLTIDPCISCAER